MGGEKLMFPDRHENKVHIQAEEEHSGRTEASNTTFDEQKMAVVSKTTIPDLHQKMEEHQQGREVD